MDLAREQVDLDVLCAQGARRRLREHAQLGANASHELGEGEGLDQIVDRARVQARDAVLDLPAGGEHDHRHGRFGGAHRGQDLQARAPRKHQVEHDRIEAAAEREPLTLASVERGVHREALGLQPPLDEVHDPRLVLDQQHPGGDGRARPLGISGRWCRGTCLCTGGRWHTDSIGIGEYLAFLGADFQ